MLVVEKKLTKEELKKLNKLKQKLMKVNKTRDKLKIKLLQADVKIRELQYIIEDLFGETIVKHLFLDTDRIVLDLKNGFLFVEEGGIVE